MTSVQPFHLPEPWETARVTVWSAAANCRLIEDEPGPDFYQEGSTPEPVWISRRDAWRDTYARGLILDLHAEPAQLHRAVVLARDAATERHRLRWWLRLTRQRWQDAPDRTARIEAIRLALSATEHAEEHAFWACAAEICLRAVHIMAEAGADADPGDRQRLLAGIRHHLSMTAFGNLIPDRAAESEQQLLDRLTEIDRQYPPDRTDTP